MLYLTTGIEISFDLHARDVLLIYFFAGIGLNSDLRSLLSGGTPHHATLRYDRIDVSAEYNRCRSRHTF